MDEDDAEDRDARIALMAMQDFDAHERCELAEVLAESFLPEGVTVWMTGAHKEFGGLTVDEMFAAGRVDEVLGAAHRLADGAFS